MTNAYVRVKREDTWQNVEIEYLTDGERNELFKEADTEELLRWLNFMCKQYEGLVLSIINEYEKEERDE